jgi:hypothetical protein
MIAAPAFAAADGFVRNLFGVIGRCGVIVGV